MPLVSSIPPSWVLDDPATPPPEGRADGAYHRLGRVARHGRCVPRARRRWPDQPGCPDGAWRLPRDGAGRWFVLVPLAFASLLTGIVSSLGSAWGLFRHYWVLFKLLITVLATIVLLIYMETFRVMAGVAADPSADLDVVRTASPGLHAALALLVLLLVTALGMYKPRGMTPYAWRKLQEQRVVQPSKQNAQPTVSQP